MYKARNRMINNNINFFNHNLNNCLIYISGDEGSRTPVLPFINNKLLHAFL